MATALVLPPPLNSARYQVSPVQDIHAFLQHHPWLVPLLVEADQAVLAAFPDAPSIHLAVAQDPEVTDGVYLVYGIVSAQPLADAQACLAAFDETWLLDHLEQLNDKVLFRLRFV